jgi:murein DD-endopeptidase MepM/ murein hydrolase activator NlpD
MKSHASPIFGKRTEPHTIIIARGDSISHFTVRPWVAALLGSALAAMAIGYLLATTYLVLRDDLMGAAAARQARIEEAYEDRISALRAQVDRIASRDFLDQQVMENKVTELMKRQQTLSQRRSRLSPLLDRASALVPLPPKPDTPAPEVKPDDHAVLRTGLILPSDLRGSVPPGIDPIITGDPGHGGQGGSAADRADRVFAQIGQTLHRIEDDQFGRMRALTDSAHHTADAIYAALGRTGIPLANAVTGAAGGPLIPIPLPASEPHATKAAAHEFDIELAALDTALDRLEAAKALARKVPIATPVPSEGVSSGFGARRDPILGTPAFHPGMDLVAIFGTPIRAAADGRVDFAGPDGGYGNMVEIDHGNGLKTRYGHMSKILVKQGVFVHEGDVIGRVGSTGRSTGPHLHYEVRVDSEPVDPLSFLRAGRAIAKIL